MASNASAVADNFGEFDDWIELYNKSNSPIDISGYFLTDNPVNLDKWTIPAGTIIPANDYLIIWADEDSSQGPYHANFKLSGSGELLMLLDPSESIVDSTSWGQQTTNAGYARVPNGTGAFVIQGHTFSANNNSVGVEENLSIPVQLSLYPNPTSSTVQIQVADDEQRDIEIYNAVGQKVDRLGYTTFLSINTEQWPAGIYYVRVGEAAKKLIVRH
ncbi:MAG: lamin tail domain-containing protein [Bacteroidetes bacterium]|nr:lamin tail domain-containing protein [Bacteroidota bacterium]